MPVEIAAYGCAVKFALVCVDDDDITSRIRSSLEPREAIVFFGYTTLEQAEKFFLCLFCVVKWPPLFLRLFELTDGFSVNKLRYFNR